MTFEKTPDGGYAESLDAAHSQPQFVGWLAMALLVLAVLFAVIVGIAAATHGA